MNENEKKIDNKKKRIKILSVILAVIIVIAAVITGTVGCNTSNKDAEYELTQIKKEVEYIMTDKETGELRTKARSSHCFLNKSGKPISLKRSYPEIDTKFFEFKEV